MLTTFSIFRILNVFYQVISTFFVYWIHLCESSYPAIIREWIWLLFLFVVLILWFKKFKPYWKHWKKTWIAFIILIVVSVLFSLLKDATWSNMFIGIKYWFRWMFILISASFVGYVISEKWQKSKLIQIVPRVLVWIVWIWFLWQWAKLLRPDFFYSLWYGGLNDYTQGENPPIYYLTWYQWTLRWQGFFSWPNNYWYFLVAFLPFVWRFFTNKIKKKEDTVLSVLALVVRMAWMVATLSRAVLVWMVSSILETVKIKKEMVASMMNLTFDCFGCIISTQTRINGRTYYKQIIHNSRSNLSTIMTWTLKFMTSCSLWMKISTRKLFLTNNAWYRNCLILIPSIYANVFALDSV